MRIGTKQLDTLDSKSFPFVAKGFDYAFKVLSGEIVACKYVIGACERLFNDLNVPDSDYYFDVEYAERYLRIVQRFEHVNGIWPDKYIKYEPWQCFVFMNIMGWKCHSSGFRRFRIAHVEIPRGQGKSLMASQAVLFFLALDNPVGNEISCVATKKDQARIVLDSARNMARKNNSFLRATGVKVLAHKLVHEASNSSARALSSDKGGLDGLKDILAVCDELHAMDREVFDLIYSGMSKRADSLTLCITTAGFTLESVGYSQSSYAKKVATGAVKDDQFFAIVYTIDDGDDIYDKTSWLKANPNYGVSVDPTTFVAKANKTKETPADLPNFKVKHLNMWLSEAQAFYSPLVWDSCASDIKLEDFRGQSCIVGLDMSNKRDLTSIGIIFKKDGKYYIFDKSFVPEETVKESNSALYLNCIGKGHLIATKGAAIDYDTIFNEVMKLRSDFNIRHVLYDPWNSTELAQRIAKNFVEVVEFRMNTGNLSEPTKTLDSLMRTGKIVHNGSPLLSWSIANVVCKEDAAGNVYPRKTHERLKIDPVIAILMALASYIQDKDEENPYESRGVLYF